MQPNISCGARLPGGNREDAHAHVDWAIIVCKSGGHIVGATSFLCSEQHAALCSFWLVTERGMGRCVFFRRIFRRILQGSALPVVVNSQF